MHNAILWSATLALLFACCTKQTDALQVSDVDSCAVEVERLEEEVGLDAEQIAAALDNPQTMAEVYGEMTERYLQQRRFATALYYARQAWKSAPNRTEQMVLRLAKCYLLNDSLDQCEQLSLTLATNGNNQSRYEAYSNLLKIANARSDQKHVYLYSDSAIHYLETIYRETMEDNARFIGEKKRIEAEAEQLRHRTTLRLWITFSLLTVLSIALMAAIAIHRTRITAARRQLEYERNRQKQQEVQIGVLRKQLLGRIDLMKRLDTERKANHKITLSPEDWTDMEMLLNEAYGDFVARLRESFPSLAEKDLRFCMLVRLGLTNHELTNVYMISEPSIKQKLFDYKAKMGISDPTVSLRRFLTDF